MSSRQAFRTFIRFQLENGVADQLGLSATDIEKIANGVEDDPTFYEKLDEFLIEYVEDFGGNYGIEW